MKKILVTETYFNKDEQNFYYVMLPDFNDQDFYRTTMSYSAFFHSMRNPHPNVTEVRQFTSDHAQDIEFRKQFLTHVDWDGLKTFNSLKAFFEFIGYEPKTRSYRSGEVMQRWNGRHFVVPKRRTSK